MRAIVFCLAAAFLTAPDFFHAPRAETNPTVTRYFTAINGLMDGKADVILKEMRRGNAVTAAVLDVCYPPDKASDRKDRFVVNLTVNGQSLSGKTESIGDKSPVTVKLNRKPTDDTFEFRGQITIGSIVTEVTSSDNSDLSEDEFRDNRTVDDNITPQPKDFSEVSPEAVGVRVKLDAALDFLKSLKGQDVEVHRNSLAATCDELRAGQQTIFMSVDPDRAAALIAKAKTMPGVTLAGWTAGDVHMDRAIRFAAAGWRTGDKVNRDKFVETISSVLVKTLGAKFISANWSAATGKLKLTFKRPNLLFPALALTDTIQVDGLIAPDKPGGSDSLMLWLSNPVVSTADEGSGAKLILSHEPPGEDDGDLIDDADSIGALTRELKGQQWDDEKPGWK